MSKDELPNPDDVLKRMLNTPPNPRRPKTRAKKRAKKRTKKPAK